MHNYLNPNMVQELREISAQGLAYIGDAVFELMVRTSLCMEGTWAADKLHSKAVQYVSAKAQADAAGKILPHLSEEETAVFKRGRNAHTRPVPKSSTSEQYHAATGIETLFGYLYLNGCTERLNELFDIIINHR